VNEPWKGEPNRQEWEAHGLRCLILRESFWGHLAGYVGIPQGHPWYGQSASRLNLDGVLVHGGVSFAQPSDSLRQPADLWWVGFDCGHLYDYKPRKKEHGLSNWSDAVYRDMDYVTRQTEGLAQQAAEVLA
jgi:hypothetical protein